MATDVSEEEQNDFKMVAEDFVLGELSRCIYLKEDYMKLVERYPSRFFKIFLCFESFKASKSRMTAWYDDFGIKLPDDDFESWMGTWADFSEIQNAIRTLLVDMVDIFVARRLPLNHFYESSFKCLLEYFRLKWERKPPPIEVVRERLLLKRKERDE